MYPVRHGGLRQGVRESTTVTTDWTYSTTSAATSDPTTASRRPNHGGKTNRRSCDLSGCASMSLDVGVTRPEAAA
jgi:hypothetical protein